MKATDRRLASAATRPWGPGVDLLCLSHLRWDFVYQRPQHLLSRCARDRRVFFFEEPIVGEGPAHLDVTPRGDNLWVAVPRLPAGLDAREAEALQEGLVDQLLVEREIVEHALWYYSPMPLGFTRHLRPTATIYDCMDELSGFAGAPPLLREREEELFRRADVVFTGGHSLYEVKCGRHPNVHAFPSSIDAAHFGRARAHVGEPPDQAGIPRPRIGYFGVIDERMDLDLLAGIADARPDWQLVMIGPVVKVDPATLPRRPNIHFLGGKSYAELPAYIAGWDVAMMPFARNDATRFISPTKTPEYLAAGKPVVSTAIHDVVRPYGARGLVAIAETVAEFVAAIDGELRRADRRRWLGEVDDFLAGNSWDATWDGMQRLISAVAPAGERAAARPAHDLAASASA